MMIMGDPNAPPVEMRSAAHLANEWTPKPWSPTLPVGVSAMNLPIPPSNRFPRFQGRTQPFPAPLPPLPPGLDARSAAVLREIVEQYVATGEPVGSRTLARPLPVSLSPAPSRTVMADLTGAGLLFAPPASAGRLPTDQGLRLFVDGLLNFGELTEDERESISAALAAAGRSPEDTLGEAN